MRVRALFAASPEWRRFGLDLARLAGGPDITDIKRTRRTLAGFLEDATHAAFIKRVDSGGYVRGMLARLFGSHARRALHGAQILAGGGFAHPQPLLIMETLFAGSIRTSFMLTEPLRDARVLSRFAIGRKRPPSLRRRVSQRVGAEIRRLHEAGIYTRDLQDTNLMLEERDAGLVVYFVDFEDFRQARSVPLKRRMRNLVHLDRSVGRFVSRTHRLRFFLDYLGRRPARDELRQLVREYEDVRARVERRARKRGSGSIAGMTQAQPRSAAALAEADVRRR